MIVKKHEEPGVLVIYVDDFELGIIRDALVKSEKEFAKVSVALGKKMAQMAVQISEALSNG